MKVLVLGGAGFVGREVIRSLQQQEHILPIVASRRPSAEAGVETVAIDALDQDHLTSAVADVDALINCITGDGKTIEQSTRTIASAVEASDRCNKLVHMSTMSVYGSQEGTVNEDSRMVADNGWYCAAKVAAESILRERFQQGLYILRPGCVYGPESHLWSLRIARLLASGRLGDLAEQGDGWSNLVHVKDVADAAVQCLQLETSDRVRTFNIVAPDSPRWNSYFRDLALGINAVPLRYLTSRRIALEGKVIAPPLKVIERLCNKFRIDTKNLPDGMAPSLFRLWQQQILLDSTAATRELGIQWVTYQEGLEESCNHISKVFQP